MHHLLSLSSQTGGYENSALIESSFPEEGRTVSGTIERVRGKKTGMKNTKHTLHIAFLLAVNLL